MGMAASQARYLALTARKTNIEYEGQQINQSRTALSNQSANLFNQMLGMSVPTAPDTSQYTKLQYSWTDGTNTSTIGSYSQLATADSDYNYVVNSSYTTSAYTGSRKKLSNPQVQATKTDHYFYDSASLDENKTVSVSKAWTNTDGTYGLVSSDGTTTVYRPVVASDEAKVRSINAGNGLAEAGATVDLSDAATKAGFTSVSATDTNTIDQIAKLYALTPAQKAAIADGDYYSNGAGGYVTKALYTAGAAGSALKEGAGITTGNYYTDGTKFVTKADLDSAVTKYDSYIATGVKSTNSINEITPEDDADYSNYTYVGNCALTSLTTSDLANADIKAEINQIMKDMKSSSTGDTISAENLASCFTTDASGNLVYQGGLYKFTMNGTTYFTTKKDLESSASSALSTNGIDNQQNTLSYYNAAYIDKKVNTTQKACIQIGSDGRFSAIKLENDSAVYDLETTTVTDTAAYNEAMNEYTYSQQVYEKAVSDINAKTEIIQSQDKQLELRLEQLNTEQSALQNEMDAVKKVVDKHVELGFKTFGG